MKNFWPAEDYETALRLKGEGKTSKAIADVLNRSKTAVKSKLQRGGNNSEYLRPKPEVELPPWFERARELLARGCTLSACAREVGVTKGVIIGHVARGRLTHARREESLALGKRRKQSMLTRQRMSTQERPVPCARLQTKTRALPVPDFRTEKQRLRDELEQAWKNTARMAKL